MNNPRTPLMPTAEEERAAIVSRLRADAEQSMRHAKDYAEAGCYGMAAHCAKAAFLNTTFADDIERGDHLPTAGQEGE